MGATLCHRCRRIISTGFTDDLYCDKHKPSNEKTHTHALHGDSYDSIHTDKRRRKAEDNDQNS